MANATKTVKSSGGDYTSLNAALAGEAADLTSNCAGTGGAGILTIECYAMNDTTAASTGTGYTTDADHYINITVPTGNGHAGKWDASKYNLTVDPGYVIGVLTILEAYVRVTKLEINNTRAQNDGAIGIVVDVNNITSDIRIEKCLIVATGATTSPEATTGIRIKTDATTRIGNNILWNWTLYGIRSYYITQNAYLYANTIVGTGSVGKGVELGGSSAGVYKYRDNIISGFNECYVFGMDGGLDASSYNLSSDATSPQSGLRNQTVSFVDSTNGTILSRDYHLQGTDTAAKDAGESLSSDGDFPISDDIDGETRTNDIGADEYVAAGASPVPLFDYYFNNMRP